MSFVNPFAPKPRCVLEDVARLKTMVRDTLGLAGGTGITVSEIICRDAACPGLETVILVMPAGEPTRLFRLPGPIAAVTAETLARATVSVGDSRPRGDTADPPQADRFGVLCVPTTSSPRSVRRAASTGENRE